MPGLGAPPLILPCGLARATLARHEVPGGRWLQDEGQVLESALRTTRRGGGFRERLPGEIPSRVAAAVAAQTRRGGLTSAVSNSNEVQVSATRRLRPTPSNQSNLADRSMRFRSVGSPLPTRSLRGRGAATTTDTESASASARPNGCKLWARLDFGADFSRFGSLGICHLFFAGRAHPRRRSVDPRLRPLACAIAA